MLIVKIKIAGEWVVSSRHSQPEDAAAHVVRLALAPENVKTEEE